MLFCVSCSTCFSNSGQLWLTPDSISKKISRLGVKPQCKYLYHHLKFWKMSWSELLILKSPFVKCLRFDWGFWSSSSRCFTITSTTSYELKFIFFTKIGKESKINSMYKSLNNNCCSVLFFQFLTDWFNRRGTRRTKGTCKLALYLMLSTPLSRGQWLNSLIYANPSKLSSLSLGFWDL